MLAALIASPAAAATLPAHGPLRVLVISDEVNPNNLSDAQLTQPGDISAALNATNSGLTLQGSATEVSSQCVDDALTALSAAQPPHVVVYFAHRPALGCNQSDQQTALTNALEAQLKRGGGVVVLHHGGYTWPGKEALMPLLGVSASSIAWNTSEGQRVFNVAPGHFVTTHGVEYDARAALSAMGTVPAGTFDYFDNLPDERYPNTALLTQTGETRTILFASNSGGTRVLGYALERPGWQGRVVFYQPAEYQPHALDDRAGPNFQILANAILYSAHQEGGANGGTGGAGATSGSAGANAGGASGGTGAAAGAGGQASGAGSRSVGGSGGALIGSAGSSAMAGGGAANNAGSSAAIGGAAAGSGTKTSNDASDDKGCSCRLASRDRGSRRAPASWLFTVIGLLGLCAVRRKRGV